MERGESQGNLGNPRETTRKMEKVEVIGNCLFVAYKSQSEFLIFAA